MRILLLTPGTGHFLCGSCLRDNDLARGLKALGHDALILPLYLPFVLEERAPDVPVRLGGINAWLAQRFPAARHAPRWLTRLLDAPRLLRWASSRGGMTDARVLGEMTLSMVRGEGGPQAGEIQRLIDDLPAEARPELVLLSNALLLGLAGPLARGLGVPVACTLQGEEPFLDTLPEPYRSRAWQELVARAGDAELFLAVSAWHGSRMAARLGLDRGRVHVVPNGVDTELYTPAPQGDGSARPAPRAPTIGYLARMCPEKGLETLVEAFLLLAERGSVPGLALEAAGVVLEDDRPFVARLEHRLEQAGRRGAFAFHPNVTREQKLAFLRRIDVLSVPATYGESFGLYVLEALACGVPVVQPRHGAFPELLEATGGGLLCAPDDPASLADGLEQLLLAPERARALGQRGRAAVCAGFTVQRMAEDVARIARAHLQGTRLRRPDATTGAEGGSDGGSDAGAEARSDGMPGAPRPAASSAVPTAET